MRLVLDLAINLAIFHFIGDWYAVANLAGFKVSMKDINRVRLA
jgi:hypothetical protein